MKKTKKLLAALFGVVMLASCMTTSVFAAETGTQDGLNAVIQTDKESYAANEDIQITVTVTNTNTFEVKNVSIESLLPEALTLKDGDLKSKTVDLKPGETLSVSSVAALEKENPVTTTEPETTETTTGIIEGELTTVDDTPDNPNTGSSSTIVKVLLIALAAAAIVAAILLITRKNSKKATKVISFVLCGAIAVSSFATVGFIKVGAEEDERSIAMFPINKSITADGEEQNLQSTITYEPHNFSFQFKIAPFDILVGEKTTVKFSATYVGNDAGNVEPIVCDNNGNQIIALNDNGENGDEIANDNIYSADLELYSDEEKFVNYYVKENNQIDSNTVEVQFYKPFTEQELNDDENFSNQLGRIIQKYVDFEGYMQEKDIPEFLHEVCEFCDTQKDVIDYYSYDKENNSVYIELKSGISYIIVPPIKGRLSGAGESEILTIWPTGTEVQDWLAHITHPWEYQDVTETAHSITNAIPSLSYPDDNKLRDEQVSVEQLKKLQPFKLLLWHSHGTYIEEKGSTLSTSTKYEKSNINKYAADIKANRLTKACQSIGIITYNYHYNITSKFIDAYFPFTNDSIVYLGACESCKDNRLAQSLINRGVAAVYGYNKKVDLEVELLVRKALFESLCTPNQNEINEIITYPTVSDVYYEIFVEKGLTLYAENFNTRLAYPQVAPGPGENSGTLSGKICMASDRTTPIVNATINIYRNDALYKTLNSDINGNYTVNLPVGSYRLEITSDGYIAFDAYATVTANNNTYMETFLLVEGEEGQTGIATGKIKNALTGNGISDVQLSVRKGWNNASFGDVVSVVTTNEIGDYTLNLPFGNYTVYATKDGYISNTFNIIVQHGTTSNQDGTVTPIISGDNYRIVLTWDENPRDLDSHVEGKLENGSSFHVYYGHKSQYDGEIEVCNLDIDDTTSYGPETITLNTTSDAPYYYYIKRYAGSGTVGTSGANINVYQGENLVATFNVPTDQGDGDYWNVFAIVNGELIAKNTITSNPDTSYANS